MRSKWNSAEMKQKKSIPKAILSSKFGIINIVSYHLFYDWEGMPVESILCIDIPVQMISCTDTNGKITPMKFRFCDRNGEIVTINIDKVLSTDQEHSSLGANFVCSAPLYGTQRTFHLRYNYFAHEWRMSRIGG